jgi:hypothetical protein
VQHVGVFVSGGDFCMNRTQRLIVLTAVGFFMGCVIGGIWKSGRAPTAHPKSDPVRYEIILIDGCQYVHWFGGQWDMHFIHKANCTNVVHVPIGVAYGSCRHE